MTTLTVDADRLTITDCSAVIVMDGETCPGPPFHGFHGPGKDSCPGVQLPAQVRRLTDGNRCLGVENGYDCGGSTCRWNHEGRPTFTLHQRCVPMCVNGTVGRWADGHLCGYCDGSGVIDLGDGWTITDVLPMHDGGTKLDTYPPDAFYWTKGEGWWRDSQFDKIVTMPPAAKPGMFVVFAEQETP